MAVEQVGIGTFTPFAVDAWDFVFTDPGAGVYVAMFDISELSGAETFTATWSLYVLDPITGFAPLAPDPVVDPAVSSPGGGWAFTTAPIVVADGQEVSLYGFQGTGTARSFPYIVNRIT